jgi:hypothetical protein
MRKLAIFTVLLLLIAVAVVVGALWLLRPAPPRTVTLANGLSIECRGTTCGTNHVTPGVSRLAGLLPRGLRSWIGLGPGRLSLPTDTPSLVAWLSLDWGGFTNPVGPVGLVCALADESGQLAGEPTGVSLAKAPTVGTMPLSVIFRALPMTSRKLRLQFYDTGRGSSGRTLMGELEFPNPVFQASVGPKPEPLPLTRTNGPVTCHLERLVAGVKSGVRQRATPEGREFQFEPVADGFTPGAVGMFRFEAPGGTGAEWTVAEVSLADAAGNVLHCGSPVSREGRRFVVTPFAPTLWPDHAWDLTIWAKRKPEASYQPEELIRVQDIEVPGLNETNQVDQLVEALGVKVWVEYLAHRPPPPSQGNYSLRDLSHLRLRVSELPEGVFFELLAITDEQGRELLLLNRPVLRRETMVNRFTPLKIPIRVIPEEVRKLTVRMVVQQGRRFEFHAQPEMVGTNGLKITLER